MENLGIGKIFLIFLGFCQKILRWGDIQTYKYWFLRFGYDCLILWKEGKLAQNHPIPSNFGALSVS
eukprot:scaffold4637_cov128-Cylindrotheca_fusiformis.AAC.28